ncbi:MAG: hypothetical protein A2176_02525 [Spirochaetes bacterium RBG_13_51_14]|nr:MAG: hypothetical protein A2176_02525 [Spirochaetes bacterium RBG_13_51_14]
MPPDTVLKYLQKLDNRPDYRPVLPGRREMHILKAALGLLPVRTRHVLQNRLLGIYCINDFTGNGLTEWVADERGTIHTFMVLNYSVFTKTVSELLTEKENTCFIKDDPALDINIDCGTAYSGLVYILLHESTHVVDYVTHITPYTDEAIKPIMKNRTAETDFTRNIWRGYSASIKQYYFSNKVSFYGIKPPAMRISEATAAYRDLCRSPFVSLYASQSWAEDLAELVTFYHISRVLKQPFIIHLRRGGKNMVSIRPLESSEVIKRLPLLDTFYRPEAL